MWFFFVGYVPNLLRHDPEAGNDSSQQTREIMTGTSTHSVNKSNIVLFTKRVIGFNSSMVYKNIRIPLYL